MGQGSVVILPYGSKDVPGDSQEA